MSDPCEVISEYGTVSETVAPYIGPQPPSGVTVARIVEVVGLTFAVFAGSTGDLSDATTNNSAATVVETGTLADAYVQTADIAITTRDSGAISDSLRVFVAETLADEAALADATTQSKPSALLADAGELSDAALPTATAIVTATETGRFSDAIYAYKIATLDDTGDLSESTVAGVFYGDQVDETGTLTDEALPAASYSAVLADAATLVDATATVLSAIVITADEGFIEDGTRIGASAAWTAPTDTFAMSRWTLPEVDSLAEIDGKLFMAGPDGLYALDGADDDGAPVNALVTGGLTDMGAFLTHTSYLYCGYTSDGTLRFTVGHTSTGVEQSVSYELPTRAATAPVPGRTKVGRGIRSRFWRFGLENVDGADFEVFDRRALTDSTGRRI